MRISTFIPGIFAGFGILTGAAVMVISFLPFTERDVALFLQGLGLLAWGIAAYYFKLIRDARRLAACRLAVNKWPPSVRVYCDPQSQKQIARTLAWAASVAVLQAVLKLSGVLERLDQ